MKTIAMYLPQFHNIPENDAWWGEGYTEWTAVKAGKSYAEGHVQPHIPYKKNYYNLLEKTVMQWQADLLHKYQIDGLCFYHYYFGNGRKILEKPAENLLEWTDIDMPFCFSWANESWIRSWSKFSGNTWNMGCATKEGMDDGILIPQVYGNKNEWEVHFNYLLPFFLDDRYLKKDGKPIFVIYYPQNIPMLSEMVSFWENLARKKGLEGLYYIGQKGYSKECQINIQSEPAYSSSLYQELFHDYEDISEQLISNAYFSQKNTAFCGFPGYDDTPRRGEKGTAFLGSSPELFYLQMKYLYYLGRIRGNEYTFINAWNEWGEGMYLEPDEQFHYAYLEAVYNAKQDSLNISEKEKQQIISIIDRKRKKGICIPEDYEVLQHKARVLRLINRILTLEDKGKTISQYFEKKYSIAIYGMGVVGKTLTKRLIAENADIRYAIDKRKIDYLIPVYAPSYKLPRIDMLIVTTVDDYELIYNEFSGNDNIKRIISVSELLDSIEET
ncbi:glycoside hydrolase family 99-like domain-containing protein [Butyrivibrio sp. WCE2006]|uniref:glycoside hydrolase family 99-like domain-containing protein n=1 Tax=Butyrivibrio sp. WCE2006 TaxID=1410611 RepID=UPI000679D734|nr:glycoside hydrolase family 99-like domain-containing protein [Butyrivibrio sp. WCE2006]